MLLLHKYFGEYLRNVYAWTSRLTSQVFMESRSLLRIHIYMAQKNEAIIVYGA